MEILTSRFKIKSIKLTKSLTTYSHIHFVYLLGSHEPFVCIQCMFRGSSIPLLKLRFLLVSNYKLSIVTPASISVVISEPEERDVA